MFLRKKIPCYVVIFDQVDIIQKSLDFFASYADKLEIIVIENPSKNSPQIKEIVERLGQRGIVKRHYLMKRNITGNALRIALDAERPYLHGHKLAYITDGDVVVSDTHWIEEQKKILQKHPEVLVCGATMDLSNLPLETFPDANNWIPGDMQEFHDFYEAQTGGHLLLWRTPELIEFMDWRKQHNLPWLDQNMFKYCYEVARKKWARTKKATAYHLTWDLYHDLDHPYTKFKLSKSFQKTWHHDHVSNYTVTEY